MKKCAQVKSKYFLNALLLILHISLCPDVHLLQMESIPAKLLTQQISHA
jgi:hypothetical protein